MRLVFCATSVVTGCLVAQKPAAKTTQATANTAAPGTLALPIAGAPKLPAADRDALADGTVLEDVLGAGGDPVVTVTAGTSAKVFLPDIRR